MEKLTETELEQTAGGQVVIYDEASRRTMRIICPKCTSRNLEFKDYIFDNNYNAVKEGKFVFPGKKFIRFLGVDAERYIMTCRDCGYTGDPRTFKIEYVSKDF